jgi:hypothetical protein
MVALPATAAKYVSMNWLERDSAPAEKQMRFSVGDGLKLLDESYFWNKGVELYGNYNLTSTGYLDAESTPFTYNHEPEVYLHKAINKEWTFDYGVLHGSDGAAGLGSRSWNRQFARVNADIWYDDLRITGSLMLWEAFDIGDNTEYITELRALGGGLFGFEGGFDLVYKDDLMLTGQFQKNFAFAGVGVNPTPGPNSYYVMLGAITGKGQNLLEGDNPERQAFVGLALAPGD